MTDLPVTLQVGSAIHRGWKGMRAQLSLQHLAGQFQIEATDTWVENGKPISRPIHGLEKTILRIGNTAVVTGLVDDASPFYRKGEVGLRVTGRDATARLADCSVEKREFIDQSLISIATALAADFSIPVKLVGFDGGKPFSRFTVDPGQTYARAIEDGCRQVGAMMWTDGLGTLLIGRPIGGPHVGTLKLGTHFLEGEAHNDFTERFSKVTVLTNKTGDDTWSNAGEAPQGQASDPAVSVYRPLVLIAETQVEGAATPAQRAAWEVTVRRARSMSSTLKVQGWLAPTGVLFRPGQRLDIDDGRLNRKTTLMIAGVDYDRSAEGTIATLTLLPEDAFQVLAEGQSTKAGGW